MKLLFVVATLSSGGAERVVATLANHWAAEGWDVTVVTISGTQSDFYELAPSVRRIAMDLMIESRHFGDGLVNSLRRIGALRRILRQYRPDLAVAMMPAANALLAISGRLAGVPAMGSERTYPPAFPLGRVWEAIRRWTYPSLNALVAQTAESAAWLRTHAPARRIAVIPNPIQFPLPKQSSSLPPVEVLNTLPGRHVLLAVGRLGEEKRFDRLLTAFAAIAGRHPEWSLVILGQGSLRDALLRQAAELGIRHRVALPGAVGNVGEWYEAASLYAMTSRFEGFPNALLEALAHGLPAVAVDCQTGPRDIIRHEVDGLLVPQDDLEALTAALDRLMGDSALRGRFSARAVEARDRYGVAQIAEQWQALFAQV